MMLVTDTPSGRELVEKTFVYMNTLSREGRKAVTSTFEQKYKGLNFDQVEPTLRREIEQWFVERDQNLKIHHEKTTLGRPGEILMSYVGSNKDAHFKFSVHGVFILTGSSLNSPSYLKSMNINVDKRDFTK
jgi:hypothetical protein